MKVKTNLLNLLNTKSNNNCLKFSMKCRSKRSTRCKYTLHFLIHHLRACIKIFNEMGNKRELLQPHWESQSLIEKT